MRDEGFVCDAQDKLTRLVGSFAHAEDILAHRSLALKADVLDIDFVAHYFARTEIFAPHLNLLIGLRQESRALSRHLQQDASLSTQDAKAMTGPSFCTLASEKVYITPAAIAGVILGVRSIRQKLKL